MKSLDELTGKLGKRYRAWKTDEKQKDKLRKEFFDLATKEVEARGLQTYVRHMYGPTEAEARARAVVYWPTLRVVEVEEKEDGFFKFLLEELPEFKPFTYVNRKDGYVYHKSISSTGTQFDDERLEQEDPELYETVTFEPEVRRQLKPISDLSDEELAKLQPYVYEGKPQVKLSSPRKAKPEDLEDG